MSKITIDTMICAANIIPVEPDDRVLAKHTLAIKDGKIFDLLPTREALAKYQANQILERPSHILIPGLINSHTHSSMTLLRGIADDLPLMEWLQNHIWPAENQWVNQEFVADGTQLAIAEMLSSGTTCFADMYFFPDIIAQVAQAAKIRCRVGLIVLDFPTIWAGDADEYISKGTDLHDKLHSHSLISTMFAPHAPYTVSDKPLQRIRTIADELNIPIQTHLHETKQEVTDAVEQTGKRPMQRLNELGLMNDGLMAVHMTQLEDSEIEHIAQNGCHVIHCPESNMKLASGMCPVGKLIEAGANVALGTDGAASNNDLDMFGEMRSAALLAKALTEDAQTLPAYTALRMATINGAKALQLEDDIGSLECGKSADVIAIDIDHFNTRPLYDPISQLVYACASRQVTDSWINGQHVLKEGSLTTIDRHQIMQKTQYWHEKIAAKQ